MEEKYLDIMFDDPEQAVLAFFETSNDESLLKGKALTFIINMISIIIVFMALKSLSKSYIPKPLEIIVGIFFSMFTILSLVLVIKNAIPLLIKILSD